MPQSRCKSGMLPGKCKNPDLLRNDPASRKEDASKKLPPIPRRSKPGWKKSEPRLWENERIQRSCFLLESSWKTKYYSRYAIMTQTTNKTVLILDDTSETLGELIKKLSQAQITVRVCF